MNEIITWFTHLGLPQSTALLLGGGLVGVVWLTRSYRLQSQQSVDQAQSLTKSLAAVNESVTARLLNRLVDGDGNGAPSMRKMIQEVSDLRDRFEANSTASAEDRANLHREVASIGQKLDEHLSDSQR